MLRKTYALSVFVVFLFSLVSVVRASELDALKDKKCTSVAQIATQTVEDFFVQNAANKLSDSLELAWKQVKSSDAECLADFSIAAYETREKILQALLFEGLLEINDVPSSRLAVRTRFEKFLEVKGISDFPFEKIIDDDSTRVQVTKQLIDHAFLQAAQQRTALQVGNYVFTPRKRFKPMRADKWQKFVTWLQEETRKNAQEFLDWIPSMWFGEDAFVRGVLRKDHEDNLYFAKVNGAFSLFEAQMNTARGLGLDMAPYYKIQEIMHQKQFAIEDRDMQTMKAVRVSVCFAPLVPLGMAAGAGGLVYVGVSATTAANIAGVSALGTSAVLTGIQMNRMKNQPGVTLADRVFLPLVTSFPAAAIVPALVGGVPALGKYLFLEGATFLRHIQVGYRYLRLNGSTGVANLLSSAPKFLLRKWVAAWWKPGVGLDKSMLAIYLANNASTFLAEYVDREFFKERPEDKFWVEGGVNKKSLYRLVPTAITGLVAAPLLTTKNFFERFIAWRMIDFASSTTMTFLVNKTVDKKFVSFEVIYGSTASTGLGEVDRVVSLAIKDSGLQPQNKFLLQTLYRLATVFPKTGLKNFFLDHYMRGDMAVDPHMLRKLLQSDMRLELNGFDDEELLEAFESLKTDSDFLHALQTNVDLSNS